MENQEEKLIVEIGEGEIKYAVFEINNKKINHILAFYIVEDGKFRKIF